MSTFVTSELTAGDLVARTSGRFAGLEGIITGFDGGAVVVNFPLTGEHRIVRVLHPRELRLVKAGPHPIPAGRQFGVIG